MAKIFVDANIFIDLVENRTELTIADLNNHQLFISPLSVHILMYVMKKKLPYQILLDALNYFSAIDFNSDILDKALSNPTANLEDNIQLHSAAGADCDFFLTSDAKLLKLKFFGKVQVISSLR